MTEITDQILSLTDILELLLLAALFFIPLGYFLGRHPKMPGLILVNLFHRSNIVSRGRLSDIMNRKYPADGAAGTEPAADDSAEAGPDSENADL